MTDITLLQASDVAQKIGMTYDGASWSDHKRTDGPYNGIAAKMLVNHLMTGDRPMRVVKAYRITLVPNGDSGWSARKDEKFWLDRDEAEDAVLACAAYNEGDAR